MLLLLISFIAGILTVLVPCILPLLPVIVGGSLMGESQGVQKKKVLTIVISLGVSVITFTLLLKVSTLFINIPEYVWKWISGGIVIILGLVITFPSLWEGQWLAGLSAKSNMLLGRGEKKKNFWGDIIIGGALGPVFSTCSPTYFIVLATVLPSRPLVGMIYLLTYALGLCLALFFIAFMGQKIMSRLNIVANPRGWLKRSLGILFLLVGIAIVSGFDKKLEAGILNAGIFDATKLEQKLLELNEPSKKTEGVNQTEGSIENKEPVKEIFSAEEKKKMYELAPEISSPDGFINTSGKPITLRELRGKVVLLDIWTYSCINCQRTLPYLNDWYSKYATQGLEIVGLHTPEFAFEKIQKNVEQAVEKLGIEYPVVLDNDYSTWNALGNSYWPRKYLIDIDGYIIYDHIGEGGYEETEKEIQNALLERSAHMGENIKMPDEISSEKNLANFDPGKVQSPEVYFGAGRNEYLANGTMGFSPEQTLTIPQTIELNKLYLGGTWKMDYEFAFNNGPANIVFRYNAKNVYFVAGSATGTEVEIYKDGVLSKTIIIKNEQLYPLIEDANYGEHTLEIKIKGSGLQAFTFTFG